MYRFRVFARGDPLLLSRAEPGVGSGHGHGTVFTLWGDFPAHNQGSELTSWHFVPFSSGLLDLPWRVALPRVSVVLSYSSLAWALL